MGIRESDDFVFAIEYTYLSVEINWTMFLIVRIWRIIICDWIGFMNGMMSFFPGKSCMIDIVCDVLGISELYGIYRSSRVSDEWYIGDVLFFT